MLRKYPKWKQVRKLNDLIIKDNSKIAYILIIPQTVNFILLKDLNKIFKKNLDISQYFELFQKIRCYTLYSNLFTLKERNSFGPIANDTSSKIFLSCLNKFVKTLNSDVKIVGPNYFKDKIDVISYDLFIENINVDSIL